MSPNGTLSANERERKLERFSAVQRRVRYKKDRGRYALNANFAAF